MNQSAESRATHVVGLFVGLPDMGRDGLPHDPAGSRRWPPWAIRLSQSISAEIRHAERDAVATARRLAVQRNDARRERDELRDICAGIREAFGYDPDEPVDLVTFVTADLSRLNTHLRDLVQAVHAALAEVAATGRLGSENTESLRSIIHRIETERDV